MLLLRVKVMSVSTVRLPIQELQPTAIVKVIPGVCSPMTATAALGLPITLRQERVVLPALLYC
jgi:precorrin-2 methylase